MHIGRHIVQELVYTFGEPEVERWEAPLTEAELAEVERHRTQGRAHDVTLVIQDGKKLAVIRRKGFPPDAYRFPSGGIHPEESFLDGAAREALEDTGLSVRIEGYLLQIHATFVCESRQAKWTTHVMLARAVSGTLAPRDAGETEAARWIEWDELLSDVNRCLRDSGLGGMSYRARLHDRVREILLSRARSPKEH
ncbi:MAG: NUDIX hydrolase [Vicinamibacteria bacterium]